MSVWICRRLCHVSVLALAPKQANTPSHPGWRGKGERGKGDILALSRSSCGCQNHEIVSDDPQEQFPRSSPGGASSQRRSEVAFDHRVDGLRLPSLAVALLVGLTPKSLLHQATVVCGSRLVGRPSGIGRNDRPHAQVQPGQPMVGLRVESGIGHGSSELCSSAGIEQQGLEERLVASAAGGGTGSEDQMGCAGHRQGQFGQAFDHGPAAAIGLDFRGSLTVLVGGLPLAFLEMSADMAGLEHGAVQGHRLDAPADHPSSLGPHGHLVEHAVDATGLDQMLEGTPQGVAVGGANQADVGSPVGAVFQQGLDSPIALFLMFSQDQAGEQLREGEVLATELAAVVRQKQLGQFIGGDQHPPWGFACFHPAAYN